MASRCENKNYTDANILHLISRLFKIFFFTVPTEDSYKKMHITSTAYFINYSIGSNNVGNKG